MILELQQCLMKAGAVHLLADGWQTLAGTTLIGIPRACVLRVCNILLRSTRVRKCEKSATGVRKSLAPLICERGKCDDSHCTTLIPQDKRCDDPLVLRSMEYCVPRRAWRPDCGLGKPCTENLHIILRFSHTNSHTNPQHCNHD